MNRLVPCFAMIAVALITVSLISGCDDGPVEHVDPADSLAHRTVSLSASPRLEPPPSVQDFVDAYNLAQSAGVTGDFRSYTWSRIEPSDGANSYDDTLARDINASADSREILLGIQVLNTTAKETPADLRSLPFDSPVMIARFHSLIDRLVARIDRYGIRYLSIGNEVDVYLASNPSEWGAYRTFLADAIAYVHTKSPYVQVGVTITHGGMMSADSTRLRDLASLGDVVIATYYPLDGSFTVRPPTSPLVDFPQMRRFMPDKQLVLQEVGYPSSELLGSSEDKQAQFISNVFNAWDKDRAMMPFLNVFLMHDITHQMCEDFAQYYGLPNNERFKAFLCSLGLRTVAGRAKPAWDVFVARGKMVR